MIVKVVNENLVLVDGANAGKACDVVVNYPDLAAEVQAQLTAQQQQKTTALATAKAEGWI